MTPNEIRPGLMFKVKGSSRVYIKLGNGEAISIEYTMTNGRACVKHEFDPDWTVLEVRRNTTLFHSFTDEAWDDGERIYYLAHRGIAGSSNTEEIATVEEVSSFTFNFKG